MSKYIIKDDVNKTQGCPLCLFWGLGSSSASMKKYIILQVLFHSATATYRTSMFMFFFQISLFAVAPYERGLCKHKWCNHSLTQQDKGSVYTMLYFGCHSVIIMIS